MEKPKLRPANPKHQMNKTRLATAILVLFLPCFDNILLLAVLRNEQLVVADSHCKLCCCRTDSLIRVALLVLVVSSYVE